MGLKTKTRKLLKGLVILSEQLGLRKSIWTSSSIDKNGNPVPWYTFPSYEYLKGLDLRKYEVLEFGSGNSSKFWQSRVKKLTSVEHNKDWYEKLKTEFSASNFTIILAEDHDDYINAAKKINYDIAIIDGVHRLDCTKAIIDFKPEVSLIILDNSDRHPCCAKLIRKKLNLIQVDFHGFGPINSYTWTTSVFFSRNFTTRPYENSALPDIPTGGLIDCK